MSGSQSKTTKQQVICLAVLDSHGSRGLHRSIRPVLQWMHNDGTTVLLFSCSWKNLPEIQAKSLCRQIVPLVSRQTNSGKLQALNRSAT